MTTNNPTDRDTTIEEIHAVRRSISERFGGNIEAIVEDARRRQAASGRPIWKSAKSQPQNLERDEK